MQGQKRLQEDIRRLRHVYTQQKLMEPSVRELLFDTVEEHEQRPSHSIRNWLAIHEDLVRHTSEKATMKRAIRGVRSICTYFTKLGVNGQSLWRIKHQTKTSLQSLAHIS